MLQRPKPDFQCKDVLCCQKKILKIVKQVRFLIPSKFMLIEMWLIVEKFDYIHILYEYLYEYLSLVYF